MRTKTLLLTAALGAAGLASASAQVFSVNAVGFVNLTIPSGFSMIANPLHAASDTVGALIPNPSPDSVLYKFIVKPGETTPSFTVNTYDEGWARPAETLEPGEGAFIFNAGAPFTVTFVGEVLQGTQTIAVPAGFSIRASKIPQSAALSLNPGEAATTPNLGFPAANDDQVFRFNNATGLYVTKNYDEGWQGGAPVPNVGESFFINKAAPGASWSRTFSVNTP